MLYIFLHSNKIFRKSSNSENYRHIRSFSFRSTVVGFKNLVGRRVRSVVKCTEFRMPRYDSPSKVLEGSPPKASSNPTQSSNTLLWALVNCGLTIILFIDINYGSISRFLPEELLFLASALKYLEIGFAVLFGWNTFFDVLLFLWPMLSHLPVREALFGGFEANDSGVGRPSPAAAPSTPVNKNKFVNMVTPLSYSGSPGLTSTPYSFRHNNQSFDSSVSSSMNNSYSSSPNLSLTSSSWNYIQGQSSPIHSGSRESIQFLSDSPNSFRKRKNSSFNASLSTLADVKITDEKGIEEYIKELENFEQKNQQVKYENQASFNYLNNMMNTSTGLLRKYQYLPACRSPSSTALADDPDFPATYSGDMVWSKFDISENQLNIWNERLRKWLSQTILLPLVTEIDNINDILCRLGSPDLRIGEVSLSSLRQVLLTKSQHVPTLGTLIPYLEMSNNQDYLVQRIRDLAKGGCMSEFRWISGGQCKGKAWTDDLPTDCSVIMHLLCSYLDTRLPSNPTYPDGKTFTSQYFKKKPDKPTLSKDAFCIYQCRLNPPHFCLVIEEETWDIPKGRSNMLHTILLFLQQVKTAHCGMLGRINLGPSGINVLWVVET